MQHAYEKPNMAQNTDTSHTYHLVYVRTLKLKLSAIENKIMANNKSNVDEDISDVNELLSTYITQHNKKNNETTLSEDTTDESLNNFYLVSSDDESSDDENFFGENENIHLKNIKSQLSTMKKEESDMEDVLRMEQERDEMINETISRTNNLKFTREFINVICEDEDDEVEECEDNSKESSTNVNDKPDSQLDEPNKKKDISNETQENIDMMKHDKPSESQ